MAIAKVNGIEIAYEVRGEGAPLVLAHFSSGSKEMWGAQIAPLSKRYRVVVYDARGHGQSSAPPFDDAGYTMATLVEDQRALMEHLAIRQAYVGGISMGGAIALNFALSHPDALHALLLFDTTADISDTPRQEGQPEPDPAAVVAFLRANGVDLATRRTWLQWAEPLGAVSEHQLPDPVREHIERVEAMSPDGLVGAGLALRQHHVLDRLAEIAAPTLILTGDCDFIRSSGERMKRRMPDARFVLIKDAAHITSYWQPAKFTSAVLDFLHDVEAGRSVAGCEER
ncbi:MAG: alpha/beta fold hydrolase [Chloroflexi bacterium]|nr:alpha/beta fold hydrolase [Chloroflexota bacterium]